MAGRLLAHARKCREVVDGCGNKELAVAFHKLAPECIQAASDLRNDAHSTIHSITSSARASSDGGAETECPSRLRLNQIEPVNVKHRCQRATTAGAHRDVSFKNGGRPRESGHAEILFSLIKLRGVFPR